MTSHYIPNFWGSPFQSSTQRADILVALLSCTLQGLRLHVGQMAGGQTAFPTPSWIYNSADKRGRFFLQDLAPQILVALQTLQSLQLSGDWLKFGKYESRESKNKLPFFLSAPVPASFRVLDCCIQPWGILEGKKMVNSLLAFWTPIFFPKSPATINSSESLNSDPVPPVQTL